MPYASMRFMDTATDYDTAYDTFGKQELGVKPMMQEGVGGLDEFAAVKTVEDLMGLMSEMEKSMVKEELRISPKFRELLSAAAREPNPRQAIKLSAKRALLNELDSSQYPEAKGLWLGLRRKFTAGVKALPAIMEREAKKMTLADKTKFLRDYARGGGRRVSLEHYDEKYEGMGWYDLVGSLASTAGGLFGAKIVGDAQKDIAKIQAGAAAQQTAAQIQIAKAQQAIAEAKVKQAAEQAKVEEKKAAVEAAKAEQIKVAGIITQEVAGIPMWALILAALALGLGVWFFFIRR